MKDKTRNTIFTAGSLVALAAGLVAGILLRNQGAEYAFVAWLELSGRIWVNLLILLVIPLAISYLTCTVLMMAQSRDLGRLGGYALLVHAGILLAGVIYSVSTGVLSLEMLGDNLPSLAQHDDIAGGSKSAATPALAEQWIAEATGVLKILGRAMLILMFLAVVLALLMARFFRPAAQRSLVVSKRIAETSMRWLTHFLLSLPFAVFVLSLPMAVNSGFSAIGAAGIFVVMISGLLIGFILLIYLAVHLWGFVSIGRFARAMIPAQTMAVSTRSSMATMPALMEAAEHTLDVPRRVTAVVIPFFVSIFRSNRVVSSPFNFLFLVYVYQLPFDGLVFALFVGVVLILSFGTLGIPSGGNYLSMPLYLAAGIPLEGYILLKAVDAVPDVFKTIVNVTEVMGVTMIVAKRAAWPEADSTLNAPGSR